MPRYYDFEVSLLDIEPRIWRRFQLTADATFEDLHEAIQDAGPWSYDHLFQFLDKARRGKCIAIMAYEDMGDDELEDCPPAPDVPLSAYFTRKGRKCIYEYDFGDRWLHLVELKGIVELPTDFRRKLLDGARSFPLEDSGGIGGYEYCLAALGLADASDFDADDLEEFREWVGDWDPEEFDLATARKEFDQGAPGKRE